MIRVLRASDPFLDEFVRENPRLGNRPGRSMILLVSEMGY